MDVILAIIAVIGFIGALPQVWGSSWKGIWLFHAKGAVPWEIVHEATINIHRQLKDSSFYPSVIIGVGRGGIIAAGLICSEMVRQGLQKTGREEGSQPEMPSIHLGTINTLVVFKMNNSVIEGSEMEMRPRIDRIDLTDLDLELKNDDKILLVVAQNFTGTTLEKAVQIVESKGLSRECIRTATLFWQKDKKTDMYHLADAHEPDFFGSIINPGKTMPWKTKANSTDRF